MRARKIELAGIALVVLGAIGLVIAALMISTFLAVLVASLLVIGAGVLIVALAVRLDGVGDKPEVES